MATYDPRDHGARCDLCPLRGATVVPPAPVTVAPRLIAIGDNPSRKDEQLGEPFRGGPGKLLEEKLRAIGVPRAEAHLTNAALCRGDRDRDNERAAECCTPRLLNELAALPDVPVVTLGEAPLKATLAHSNLMNARGFVWDFPEVEGPKPARKRGPLAPTAALKADTLAGRAALAGRRAPVLPTIHPAFVLRSQAWGGIFDTDMARVGRAVRGELGGPLEDVAPYVNPRDPSELYALGPRVAIDVETDGIDALHCKLLCVGLSDGERTLVIWPWEPRWAPPLSAFLRTRTAVIGHNVVAFDRTVLEMHGVK